MQAHGQIGSARNWWITCFNPSAPRTLPVRSTSMVPGVPPVRTVESPLILLHVEPLSRAPFRGLSFVNAVAWIVRYGS